MNTTYLMHADIARFNIDQRLRDADNERRRRLARHGAKATSSRIRHLPWR